MKSNKWLESPEFISKIKFYDAYYLETLLHKVAAFIKNAPVPILSTWDAQHNSIYLSIGENKQYFSVDINIAYYDFITLMKKWTSSFYPHYQIQIDTEIPYTDEEILDMVKNNGIDLNDAILLRKPHSYIERGVIEKVYITKEEFILSINGKKQIRVSGNLSKGINLPISKFMENIRQIKSDTEMRYFIFENSKKKNDIIDQEEIIEIDYFGKQMLNFFKINFPDLKNRPIIKLDDFTYQWANFKLKFESKILAKDCLELYDNLKEKYNK